MTELLTWGATVGALLLAFSVVVDACEALARRLFNLPPKKEVS